MYVINHKLSKLVFHKKSSSIPAENHSELTAAEQKWEVEQQHFSNMAWKKLLTLDKSSRTLSLECDSAFQPVYE